uniref:Bet1-like SNARE 1-1 n=1 Tax=Rhizophora mucronata TaxID=61149 RepID=A0A2P2LRF6_RHIMU
MPYHSWNQQLAQGDPITQSLMLLVLPISASVELHARVPCKCLTNWQMPSRKSMGNKDLHLFQASNKRFGILQRL